MAKNHNLYDTVIIGAGCTGLAAAMYAGRLNLKTLVLGASHSNELPTGGVITLTEIVENYPGFIRLTGPELAKKLEDHALDYKEMVEIKEEKALDIIKNGDCFTVKTDSGSYNAKTLIFTTGTQWKKLPMKGAKEFESKGVHYCALCDGAIYKKKTVAIIGGSDTAAKEALLLSELCREVYIIYRGEKIRPEPINGKRIEAKGNIHVITNTNVIEIAGGKFVDRVILDRPYNGSNILELNAVFGAIGNIPLSGLARKLGIKTNEKGEIIINRETETNIKGVFAAGDVVDSSFKQAITGVGEGVTAAHSAFRYVSESTIDF
ncbi:MAG: FAD-dependent oxidoreductase [Candidatus Aenigmarchaeota archaeon]|nr:FAD-dependent oxidoreductase [Candidatus Aenigmarchaeota archaeon]